MKKKKELVKQLKDLILKGNAHVTLEDAVAGAPGELVGVVPEGLPYSLWQLLEHIRIAQNDILEFSRNARHKSPEWPEGYWPREAAPKKKTAWSASLKQILKDREAFIDLLEADDADLYTPFAHGDGQNLLREALLLADHAAYHTAEIIVIRRLLGNWE